MPQSSRQMVRSEGWQYNSFDRAIKMSSCMPRVRDRVSSYLECSLSLSPRSIHPSIIDRSTHACRSDPNFRAGICMRRCVSDLCDRNGRTLTRATIFKVREPRLPFSLPCFCFLSPVSLFFHTLDSFAEERREAVANRINGSRVPTKGTDADGRKEEGLTPQGTSNYVRIDIRVASENFTSI